MKLEDEIVQILSEREDSKYILSYRENLILFIAYACEVKDLVRLREELLRVDKYIKEELWQDRN